MSNPTTDTGMSLVFFAAEQTAIKTIASGIVAAAGDAIRVINAQASPSGKTGLPRNDKLNTATRVGDIPQQRGWSGTVELYPYPSGSLLGVPDWAVLLDNAGFERLTGPSATTVSGSSSTTTRVDLTSSSGLSAGMWLSVPVSGTTYWRRITEVDSVGTDVVVSPPLPSGPAASAAVSFGISWKFKDEATCDGDSLTCWIYNDVTAERWIGWVPNTITLTGGGAQEPRLTLEGPIYRRDYIIGTTLTANISNSDTTVPVTLEYAVPDDVASGTKIRMILDDGTNQEVVDVTASDGAGDLTVTRNVLSAGAYAFNSGSALRPYHPTPTVTAQDPLPGTVGDLAVWQSSTEITLYQSSWTLTINRNLQQRTGVWGSEFALDHLSEGMRDVTLSTSGWAYRDSSLLVLGRGIERETFQTVLRAGSTEGRVMLAEAPIFYVDEAPIPRGADDITLDLAGDCRGTDAGEDELFFAVM